MLLFFQIFANYLEDDNNLARILEIAEETLNIV